MVSGPQHETTQGRPATAIRIPVVLCGAPGVRTKILSTKKKGPGCKHRSRSHGESGEVFSLDILSHRMSDMGMFRQSARPRSALKGNQPVIAVAGEVSVFEQTPQVEAD